jgi:hypothetical protein
MMVKVQKPSEMQAEFFEGGFSLFLFSVGCIRLSHRKRLVLHLAIFLISVIMVFVNSPEHDQIELGSQFFSSCIMKFSLII